MHAAITPTNSLTSRILGSIALAGAEISAYDAGSRRVFTTSFEGLQIIDLSDPADLELYFSRGGWLVLLGVSDASLVDYLI